ncbi:hypothetical protein BGZ83_005945 [Gryganskiella cystojenkinii]|nr:hypothetical protein BGZ83_005945 [Gryganskiella cystojenkinii]
MLKNSPEFLHAADRVKELTTRPSDEDFLELYGLYKQAIFGDNNTPTPGGFDMKKIFKHESWQSKQGLTREEAETQYIALVTKLTNA